MNWKLFLALAITAGSQSPSIASEITIQTGETLSEIAKKYNISETELIRLNNLQNPNRINSGQKLILPESIIENSLQTSGVHKVKSGETLSLIAERYNVREYRLIELNQLKRPDFLLLGQEIKIPGESIEKNSDLVRSHKVLQGETLGEIALMYKTKQAVIIKKNRLSNENFLKEGQILIIPGPELSKTKKSIIKHSTNHNDVKSYTILPGDTLASIARSHEIPLSKIIKTFFASLRIFFYLHSFA